MKIVVAGVGAAGVACSKMLHDRRRQATSSACDRVGAIYKGRKQHMNFDEGVVAENTNPFNEQGTALAMRSRAPTCSSASRGPGRDHARRR